MAALESDLDGMSQAAQFKLLECATYPHEVELGRDPLEILIELEQLATDYGYADVHQFIQDYMR